MKYVVDGYNLLFRSLPHLDGKNIRLSREKLIPYLDRIASVYRLDITVVFDSMGEPEEARRGHFNAIEVVYTSRAISADHYIQELCRLKPSCTVVTSDKKLAASVAHGRTKTMSIEAFLLFLTKKHEQRSARTLPKSLNKLTPPKLTPQRKKSELPPLSDIDAWVKIFSEKGQK